jgi:hypothetical protein
MEKWGEAKGEAMVDFIKTEAPPVEKFNFEQSSHH